MWTNIWDEGCSLRGINTTRHDTTYQGRESVWTFGVHLWGCLTGRESGQSTGGGGCLRKGVLSRHTNNERHGVHGGGLDLTCFCWGYFTISGLGVSSFLLLILFVLCIIIIIIIIIRHTRICHHIDIDIDKRTNERTHLRPFSRIHKRPMEISQMGMDLGFGIGYLGFGGEGDWVIYLPSRYSFHSRVIMIDHGRHAMPCHGMQGERNKTN